MHLLSLTLTKVTYLQMGCFSFYLFFFSLKPMVVEIPGIKFLSCYIFDKNQFVFHLISQQHIKKIV